jgi:hypothetical protein
MKNEPDGSGILGRREAELLSEHEKRTRARLEAERRQRKEQCHKRPADLEDPADFPLRRFVE